MGINYGRLPTMTRTCVLLLAVAFVSLLSWSPSGGDAADPMASGSRLLAPGLENGVTRAAPAVARAQDPDRSIDRRPFPPLAAVVLLAGCLGALALTVSTMMVEGRRAFGGEPCSPLGSRAPPRRALA